MNKIWRKEWRKKDSAQRTWTKGFSRREMRCRVKWERQKWEATKIFSKWKKCWQKKMLKWDKSRNICETLSDWLIFSTFRVYWHQAKHFASFVWLTWPPADTTSASGNSCMVVVVLKWFWLIRSGAELWPNELRWWLRWLWLRWLRWLRLRWFWWGAVVWG